MSIWWALFFMALGGIMVHLAWCHSWRMYKSGKAEGQSISKNRNGGIHA